MIIAQIDSSVIETIRNPNNQSLFQSYYPKFQRKDFLEKMSKINKF